MKTIIRIKIKILVELLHNDYLIFATAGGERGLVDDATV
jgi:hypothetical protein